MTTATYETDFYLWTQQQADLLRQGALSAVDVDHLAEEIDDMGRSQKNALQSYLFNVIMHLLKWQYQPERRGTSWQQSIDNGRNSIERLLENNPSLVRQLPILVEAEYHRSHRQASRETALPVTTFPEQCPFTVEQITGDYWPN
ncbi:MAG: DUF29 domain-containing protein [Candidatus Competibacteraceae bacterium]|jgi:hypothetical protein